MKKWTRKTKEFEFAPYIDENGEYRIQEIDDQPIVKEYEELKAHNWDNDETHKRFIDYCKENKIRLNSANWAVVNNKTNEVIKFPFKTVKAAKEFVETL